MSPEERELLEKSVALAEDNNKMLHTMRRSMMMARIMSYIYWLFIIGSAVVAYYYAQPYINQATRIYQGASDAIDSLKKIGS